MQNLYLLVPKNVGRKASRLAILTQRLHHCLPIECHSHCQVIELVGKKLEILADSPAWATRIRFYNKEIVHNLNKIAAIHLQTIKVKVGAKKTVLRKPATSKKRSAIKSTQAAVSLQHLAESINDPKLSQSLQRLATHVGQTAKNQKNPF
ncbi:MAG: DUF721 domain-containing protein [Gammaproteobacteria bacterium]|nr:DUF721 domain-containing protein [Gammaproteobacteria bacterium]